MCDVTDRGPGAIPGVSNAEAEEVFGAEKQSAAQSNTEVDATQPLLDDAKKGVIPKN